MYIYIARIRKNWHTYNIASTIQREKERESSSYISTLYNINIIQFERSEIFGARIFSTQTTIQFNLSSELFACENHCKANASCLCPFACKVTCIRFFSWQIVRITWKIEYILHFSTLNCISRQKQLHSIRKIRSKKWIGFLKLKVIRI